MEAGGCFSVSCLRRAVVQYQDGEVEVVVDGGAGWK